VIGWRGWWDVVYTYAFFSIFSLKVLLTAYISNACLFNKICIEFLTKLHGVLEFAAFNNLVSKS
jgi:hypothetical protein